MSGTVQYRKGMQPPAHRWGGILFLMIILLWGCATAPAPVEQAPFYFFPPFPDEPRIQFLANFAREKDFIQPKRTFLDFVLGLQQEGGGVVQKPYGVAIKDGIIYVCDTAENAIDVLDISGAAYGRIGGDAQLRFKKPINITVDEEGRKYIADSYLGSVVVLDSQNRFVRTLASPDKMRPTDVGLFGNRAYVVDVTNHQLVVFDRTSGAQLKRIGSNGKEPGQFASPTNIAIDQAGNLYVSDTGGYRIQKLDPEGRPLKIFGRGIGDQVGYFSRPRGVAVDREGRVYSVDARHMVVQIFDPENNFLMYFGGPGAAPGCLNLPAQIVVDYDNVDLFKKYAAPGFEIEYLLIVTSQYGYQKVSVFGFGHRQREGGAGAALE